VLLKKWSIIVGLLFLILLLSACSLNSTSRGMQQTISITEETLPEENAKEDVAASIESSSANQIDALIADHFSLADTVQGDTGTVQVYATINFEHEELASLLTSSIQPQETSEVVDGQQIFIYPEHFVTLKPSPDDETVLLIEVAPEQFVRNNYAPSFLSTFFTIQMLNSLFGNGWANSQAQSCQAGNCYGGYTSAAPNRGNTTFRGGGTNAGK